MVIENIEKKGWIKIVEAFVSILLIVGVVLVVINKGYISKDISREVYETQISILRSIQLDDTLRSNILVSNKSGYNFSSGESPLPINWDEFDDDEQRILKDVKDKIILQVPNNLDCQAKICGFDDVCTLNEEFNVEIYAEPATIVANYEVFSPRQLKLFCWEK